jgi:hypothetical protein
MSTAAWKIAQALVWQQAYTTIAVQAAATPGSGQRVESFKEYADETARLFEMRFPPCTSYGCEDGYLNWEEFGENAQRVKKSCPCDECHGAGRIIKFPHDP